MSLSGPRIWAAWPGMVFTCCLLCCIAAPPAWAAVGVSPGLCLVRNVRPGQEVSMKDCGQPISAINFKGKAGKFSIRLESLAEAGQRRWEYGYEPLPKEWVTLPVNEADVPDDGTHPFDVLIKIPDEPRNYNRRFVFAASVRRGGAMSGVGVALAAQARIMLETTTLEDKDGSGGAPVMFVPSGILVADLKPGEKREDKVQLYNNTARDLTFVRRCLMDYYPPRENETEAQAKARKERKVRYHDAGIVPIVDASWVTITEVSPLKAGENTTVKLVVQVPPGTAPGKYEELVFLDGDAVLLPHDVRNWPELAMQLAAAADAPEASPAKRVWELLPEDVRGELKSVAETRKAEQERGRRGKKPTPEEAEATAKAKKLVEDRRDAWLAALNAVMARPDFYRAEDFAAVKLPPEAAVLKEGNVQLKEDEAQRVNRALWEAAFPDVLESRTAHGAYERAGFLRVRITVPEAAR